MSGIAWLAVWSIGWLLWLGYWCHVAVIGGDSGEVSERGVRVAWWLFRGGLIGAAVTAFLLPASDLFGGLL